MSKKINKSKLVLVTSIILSVLSLALSIFTLVLVIKSYSFYDDGYGISVEFDSDYIVYFLASMTLFIYSIIVLKNQNYELTTTFISFGIIEVLLSFYPLGIFFKAISKKKPFVDNVHYLIIGVIFLVLLVLTCVFYFRSLKKNKQQAN